MSNNKRIYLASPHMCGLEEKFVKEAFDTNWIAPMGPHLDAFEKEISEMAGVRAATVLSSGTAAIHMALRLAGVGREDIVFCSSLTFSGSCNPIIYEGAMPVFIDSEYNNWNMSPRALEIALDHFSGIGKTPKAVIVVNLYGQSADMDPINDICKKYGTIIIEDAAESFGATYKGKFSGTIGDFGVYSFNGNKIITTSGGGALVSNNEEAIKKVKFWSTQSREAERYYQHKEVGYNYRMSNVLAAIGRGQLRILGTRITEKKKIFETYKRELADITDIEFMPIEEYGNPNYWLSVITLNTSAKVKPIDIILALEEENIESRPVWKPMHLQPIYKECDFYSHNDAGISVSEDIFNRGVCLPSDTKMTENELDIVIKTIRKLFK